MAAQAQHVQMDCEIFDERTNNGRRLPWVQSRTVDISKRKKLVKIKEREREVKQSNPENETIYRKCTWSKNSIKDDTVA